MSREYALTFVVLLAVPLACSCSNSENGSSNVPSPVANESPPDWFIGCDTQSPTTATQVILFNNYNALIIDKKTEEATDFTINVYFHVISNSVGDGSVGDPKITEQFNALCDVFGLFTRFKFKHARTDRFSNDKWYAATRSNIDSANMKRATKKDNDSRDRNLHIWITGATKGWSTWPEDFFRQADRELDGVVIPNWALPDDTKPEGYYKGYYLVHEVGHWLGLYHPFENGCGQFGDSDPDTPPQGSEIFDCETVESCPGGSPYSVDNLMGYTSDKCRTRFTLTQAERMEDTWINDEKRRRSAELPPAGH